ncbi:MAG: hypothetical protein OEX79_09530, partial [Nitrosopumilus sp.]|nr:hypothetical protein [Nitrosopumilus sp.]
HSLESESIKQKQNLEKLRSEKDDLEKTQSNYDAILAEIEQEKLNLLKYQKLKDSLRLENDNLIKSKEQCLDLINSITKEKQIISTLKKDEQKKLIKQNILAKQLKKEKDEYEKLKIKQVKDEQKIKKQYSKSTTRSKSSKTKTIKPKKSSKTKTIKPKKSSKTKTIKPKKSSKTKTIKL